MHIYTLQYLGTRDMDRNVGARSLRAIAQTLQPHELVTAKCENWDGHVLYHWEGAFEDSSDLPTAASQAYDLATAEVA